MSFGSRQPEDRLGVVQAPDGRNLYDPQSTAELGFEYYSVGRAPAGGELTWAERTSLRHGLKGATEEPA